MRSTVLEQVIVSPRLPSLPAVALQVLELTRQDVDLPALAEVIRKDQALASKVLRTVNSSYYGLSRPCATIREALVYLGVDTVRTLVLGFALVDTVDGVDDVTFDYMTYWKRGLYAAAAARQLAGEHGQVDPDEAFLAGLIQDIGMIALYRHFGDRYLQIIDMTGGDDRKLPHLEQEAFRLDHCEVGGELARRWQLPPQLIETIRHHHETEELDSPHVATVQTVQLANAVALILTLPNSDDVVRWMARQASAWFGLSAVAVQRLLNEATHQVSELASLFRVQVGHQSEATMALAQAEERLTMLQIELERERNELREANRALSRQRELDPLTNIANRLRFDAYLQDHFHRAQAEADELSLIYCNVDGLKPINDAHGHKIGDAVLREVACRLEREVGAAGLAARYGGDEFAIILPGADCVAATMLAERLRQTIEASPIALPALGDAPEAVHATASLGVATLDPSLREAAHRPDLLLRLADQAVRAAKNAGRNGVRVFTSRRTEPRWETPQSARKPAA